MPLFVASIQDSLQALNRVVSLLRGRHFQVKSITRSRSERPEVARLTIVVDDSQPKPHRVASHLEKLEEAWSVASVDRQEVVCRAMALVKLSESLIDAGLVATTLESGSVHLVDQSAGAVILEVFGTIEEVDRVLASFPPNAIIELARPGELAMTRGARPTSDTASPNSF
jgi:acetolactate synthase I/III small subunit